MTIVSRPAREPKGGAGAKPVNALVRGLRVLAVANEIQRPTVAELVRRSRLPKATVIRLVQTLVHEGYLEESGEAEGYQVTAKVRNLSRALVERTPIAQLVQPLLDELGARVKWPSEFFLAEGRSVVIEVSNRSAAPIKLNLFETRRFPMVASATGLAYLSALPPGEAARIVEDSVADGAVSGSVEGTLALIAAARERGYATWEYPALAPGLRMVSIPVPAVGGAAGKLPVGGLSLVHFRDLVPAELMDGFLLPEMRAVAARIGAVLDDGWF
ncbi:transcriptional regulator (plasmid) [Azospirillum sp. B510]|uniref:IclR family transcriptional regulator n=1 Tax=Azospirillum sp. (strain B510) TaxID=137722 RepID=UPI0001C4C6F9|nr:helix-turn-helix domain-containing protein [Azospirillum sp. B510]BAI75569.1 transcriptional regulator [Azospirillum sp. B510]